MFVYKHTAKNIELRHSCVCLLFENCAAWRYITLYYVMSVNLFVILSMY